jgi:FkbM family methyltransferase
VLLNSGIQQMAVFSLVLAFGSILFQGSAVSPVDNKRKIEAGAANPSSLRGAISTNASSLPAPHVLVSMNKTHSGVSGPNCNCKTSDPAWKPCSRTTPRCVFIDLGAADGNSFNYFLKNGYGNVLNCPSVQWSAVLVEANPRFDSPLAAVGKQHQNALTVMSSTAAYMCEAKTSFFLDTVNTEKNFWGSSMSQNHPDVKRSGGQQKVTVPTVNLNKILFEETIPGDWVMVKMDIEGAEFDVLPCLSKAPSATLVDRLYLEQHDPSWGNTGTTLEQMEAAKNELRNKGVDIPNYFSQTF